MRDYYLILPGQSNREMPYDQFIAVQRDICYLYHELAEYSFIMGDLAFGATYALPYWDYLQIGGFDEATTAFVRDGCLVMLLTMAWECIDQAGSYLLQDNRIRTCQAAVQALPVPDERTRRLTATVQAALDLAASENVRNLERLDHISNESDWVHRAYVREYFRERVRAFDENPYFHEP